MYVHGIKIKTLWCVDEKERKKKIGRRMSSWKRSYISCSALASWSRAMMLFWFSPPHPPRFCLGREEKKKSWPKLDVGLKYIYIPSSLRLSATSSNIISILNFFLLFNIHREPFAEPKSMKFYFCLWEEKLHRGEKNGRFSKNRAFAHSPHQHTHTNAHQRKRKTHTITLLYKISIFVGIESFSSLPRLVSLLVRVFSDRAIATRWYSMKTQR
jgi:hypothetical protein